MNKFSAVLLGFLLNVSPALAAIGSTSTETITVNLASTGYTIPADFVGFSIETASVIPGNFVWQTGQSSLCSLINLIGSNGLIRIGGLSQDQIASSSNLTLAVANGIEAFRQCLGSSWKISWGLNGDPRHCLNASIPLATARVRLELDAI